jgi:nitroimidazol reductase NimA-like FMN-containing flavoprotein (pyridoxamine 5'-phosphate oxidase superfamily)
MTAGSRQLAPLTVRECWACLRSVPVGRLVYTERALPAIRPVNFALHGNCVVIWSLRGSKVRSIRQQVVAFEADHFDPATHTGWSVVVIGKVEVVSDEDELLSVIEAERRPWIAGEFDHVLRIPVQEMTGRRLALLNGRSAQVRASAD